MRRANGVFHLVTGKMVTAEDLVGRLQMQDNITTTATGIVAGHLMVGTTVVLAGPGAGTITEALQIQLCQRNHHPAMMPQLGVVGELGRTKIFRSDDSLEAENQWTGDQRTAEGSHSLVQALPAAIEIRTFRATMLEGDLLDTTGEMIEIQTAAEGLPVVDWTMATM